MNKCQRHSETVFTEDTTTLPIMKCSADVAILYSSKKKKHISIIIGLIIPYVKKKLKFRIYLA